MPAIDLSKAHLRVWIYALALHAALFSVFYGPDGSGVLFIVVGGGVIVGLARIYHDGDSFVAFVGQVSYAYFVLGLLSALLTHIGFSDLAIDTAVGIILGWSCARAKTSMAPTGEWIWIVPAPIFAYSFLHDWFWPCKFCPAAKTAYFSSSAELQLLTVPAFSLSGYSIGSWIASRKRVQTDPPALL